MNVVRFGDVVRLTQGSPPMLVLRITGTQAICTWLDYEGDRMEIPYSVKLLRVVGRGKLWFS